MGRNTVESFPARLRQLREGKGLSRDQVAVAAGTSSHSIAKLEQGTRSPSLELAWRVARALGCTLDELVRAESEEEARNRLIDEGYRERMNEDHGFRFGEPIHSNEPAAEKPKRKAPAKKKPGRKGGK